MTEQRQKASELAQQILHSGGDLQWLEPLAREFVFLHEREKHPRYRIDADGNVDRLDEVPHGPR